MYGLQVLLKSNMILTEKNDELVLQMYNAINADVLIIKDF